MSVGLDRYGNGVARDRGIRTRRADRRPDIVTPESTPDWMTTFQLRWNEYLRQRERGRKGAR